MQKHKNILTLLPEVYLLIAICYYWVLTAAVFNPVAMILIVMLALPVVLNNKVLGVVTAGAFILLNLYMFLALLSDVNDYATITEKARQQIVFGSVYLGLNLTMSIVMAVKYARYQNKQMALS